ncbi:AraC family transcriptional regulator [Seongchinamella unica]|uniref:AraC family transcriptional regulator n=1 Tax=Seongchinamella unica TaxID=2547392 RepID=A0A4R5LNU7_9GAMM|nr:AraC family transcriptional regulator [Seongchinamella unica]TDG12047.1 AraC family transcriptional regulator [Seongchinamella unica]
MASVSTHHFLAVMRGAQLKGWSRQNLLLEAGIPDQVDYCAEQRFTIHQMTRLTRTIWRVLDDEFMGFTKHPCKSGAFSFALQTMRKSHNLHDALLTGFEFYRLAADDIATQLIVEDDIATIDIRFAYPEFDPQHYFEEFWMVIWHRLISWLSGVRIPLRHVRFRQQQPAYKKELHYMFPGKHDYGCETSQLEFDAKYLALPLVRSQKETELFLARSPYNLLSIPGSDGTLQGEIMSQLTPTNAEPLCFPDIEELARTLNVSGTTLRRRLQEESTNYTEIKTELRRQLAYKMLSDAKVPIGKVAEAVGFSETSAFGRAFKEWSGFTPRQYRSTLLNPAGSS